jgi:glycosylphosphatidylinositol transamidase (GPIT) subunit GPI8
VVFNDADHALNLYGDDVEVDYRGDEVTVENLLRLLTGAPRSARAYRLMSRLRRAARPLGSSQQAAAQ